MKQFLTRIFHPQSPRPSGCRIRFSAALFFFLAAALIMLVAATVPGAAQWYWETLYQPASRAVSRVTGSVPFSIAEIGLYLLAAVFLLSLIHTAARMIRSKEVKHCLILWCSYLLPAASILAFFFMLGGGVNYHHASFAEEAGITAEPISVEDLENICLWLTDEVNAWSSQVQRGSDGVMQLSRPEGPDAAAAMEHLGETFPGLSGSYPPPKKVFCSEILSRLGLTGIFSAFTIEANYNKDMTPYNIPFTVCHELSHLKGFMQEEEANFIAFLACIGSGQPDFIYSGFLSAWIYCMNALYDTDRELWSAIRSMLTADAEPDLSANSAFWNRYDGVLSDVSTQVNDAYLKFNGQPHGVQSYDRMVELIVTVFKDHTASAYPDAGQ